MVRRIPYLSREDGFIREVLWVALAIAIVAVVLLDGMSIFTAHQSVREDAATAAREARTDYAQSLSLPLAEATAEQYLTRSGLKMISFEAAQNEEGVRVFTVKAKADAETRVFKFLRFVPGLEKWVERTTHPTATGKAD